jgi:hypothetical protein
MDASFYPQTLRLRRAVLIERIVGPTSLACSVTLVNYREVLNKIPPGSPRLVGLFRRNAFQAD